MSFFDLLWIFIILSSLQPIVRQRLLEQEYIPLPPTGHRSDMARVTDRAVSMS